MAPSGVKNRHQQTAGFAVSCNATVMPHLRVLLQCDHCLLVGEGASDFAQEMGVQEVPADALVAPEAQKEFEQYMEKNSEQKCINSLKYRTSSKNPHVFCMLM